MPSTTNFGWTTPADTDLVKDGAAAIRTLGNGIDTSFLDLKGGTSGQILAKNSNTDLDFVWVANDQGDITAVTAGTGISGGGTSGAVTITNSMATEITAKGDLIVGTGNATFDNLAVGANGTSLVADSSTATGLKWASASSGMTLVQRSTFSNVADTSTTFDGVFTSTYGSYLVIIENFDAATLADDAQLQLRSGGTTKTNNYFNGSYINGSGSVSFTALNNSSTSLFQLSTDGYIFGQLFFNGSNVRGQINSQLNVLFSTIQGFVDSYGPDGFLLKSASSNVSGTVAVYGLAK